MALGLFLHIQFKEAYMPKKKCAPETTAQTTAVIPEPTAVPKVRRNCTISVPNAIRNKNGNLMFTMKLAADSGDIYIHLAQNNQGYLYIPSSFQREDGSWSNNFMGSKAILEALVAAAEKKAPALVNAETI